MLEIPPGTCFAFGGSFSSEEANDIPPPNGSPQLQLHRQAPFKPTLIRPTLETPSSPPPVFIIGEPCALHRRRWAQRWEGALPRRALGLPWLVLPPKRHLPGCRGVHPHRPSQLIAAGAMLQEMGRRCGGLHGFRLWSHSLVIFPMVLIVISPLVVSLVQWHGGGGQFI